MEWNGNYLPSYIYLKSNKSTQHGAWIPSLPPDESIPRQDVYSLSKFSNDHTRDNVLYKLDKFESSKEDSSTNGTRCSTSNNCGFATTL